MEKNPKSKGIPFKSGGINFTPLCFATLQHCLQVAPRCALQLAVQCTLPVQSVTHGMHVFARRTCTAQAYIEFKGLETFDPPPRPPFPSLLPIHPPNPPHPTGGGGESCPWGGYPWGGGPPPSPGPWHIYTHVHSLFYIAY